MSRPVLEPPQALWEGIMEEGGARMGAPEGLAGEDPGKPSPSGCGLSCGAAFLRCRCFGSGCRSRRSIEAASARDGRIQGLRRPIFPRGRNHPAEKLTRDYQLEYNRTKTRNRRADQAVQKLHVPESVRPLFDKYRDPYQRRVFKFYRKYLNLKGFNHAINQGLKKLGKECGIPGLYYYQARHTFASLAHNDLKFSIENVSKCLTHAPVMRVTIAYVKEDFSIVDEVNQAVVDYVLAF